MARGPGDASSARTVGRPARTPVRGAGALRTGRSSATAGESADVTSHPAGGFGAAWCGSFGIGHSCAQGGSDSWGAAAVGGFRVGACRSDVYASRFPARVFNSLRKVGVGSRRDGSPSGRQRKSPSYGRLDGRPVSLRTRAPGDTGQNLRRDIDTDTVNDRAPEFAGDRSQSAGRACPRPCGVPHSENTGGESNCTHSSFLSVGASRCGPEQVKKWCGSIVAPAIRSPEVASACPIPLRLLLFGPEGLL